MPRNTKITPGQSAPSSGAPLPLTAERATALLWHQAPNIALVLLDADGSVIGWRAASEAMFGFTEAEVLGRPIDFLFTEEDVALGLEDLEREVALSAGRSEDDRWHVRKDGSRLWVTGTLVALHEGGRHVGYAKIMADRTNLRAQLETMENRLAKAQEASSERDIFFSRLTHEVRNALGPIRSVVQLLERRGWVTAELESPLSIVKRQVDQMGRMMGDLAEMVRVGLGKLQLQPELLDLAQELREIGDTVRADVEGKSQTLSVLVPPSPLRIRADKARLHQIVFNLLHNAIKYTPAGGRLWLQCTLEIDQAVIKVEDTGVGIEPALLPAIFDLFTQENPAQSEGGFGVGLSLVKELVAAHGGYVEVRCDGKDRGSEFTVRLPINL